MLKPSDFWANVKEYMDSWQRLAETPIAEKNKFYSNLAMKDITDAD